MTPERTTELAKQAGPLIRTPFDEWCQRFAELMRNEVLEEAAKKSVAAMPNHPDLGEVCAEQIRSMKK